MFVRSGRSLLINQSIILIFTFYYIVSVDCDKAMRDNVISSVKYWSNRIGGKLVDLSKTMTRHKKAEKEFETLSKNMYKVPGTTLVNDVARKIRIMMDEKAAAVEKIAQYAEFLSYYRPDDPLFPNSSYNYFNADNITNNDFDPERNEEIANDIVEGECHWWCHQKDLPVIPGITSVRPISLFKRDNDYQGNIGTGCDCKNLLSRDRDPETYQNLPMVHDDRFGEKVNLNLSITKVAINVYNRDQQVLEGVRWSEALDLIFKDNFKNDSTLTWQYFASPRGFMRHYPSVKWSEEQYDKTYDFRTRSWYTEAMTSPKDIIILLDRSGSMTGEKIALSKRIVNDILDTLNDNDFVNIYTFTNTTEPLIACFNDTLVQANEENLRLLRESLSVYELKFAADLSLGVRKAFDILESFRRIKKSAKCIQSIMLITEGVDYDYNVTLFKDRNSKKNYPVRIFTYQIGSDPNDAKQLEWIACNNMGYYVNMTFPEDIREKILNYLNVMSRPINYDHRKRQKAIWSYLHVDLADRRFSNWLWRKHEGIRQREVFIDHIKRETIFKGKMLTSAGHMLLLENHDYKKYEKPIDYNYMTTVSMPVYGRRKSEVELIGVAGIDVPIKLIKSLIPYHILGVNGYAFIVTNNGYVLMHPDHRKEFENILKPTFNRVDLLEVEIHDDENEPRLFHKKIVELRENIVHRNANDHTILDVKFTLHNMKRVILSKRRYYSTEAGPFTFGIGVPDEYGLFMVNTSQPLKEGSKSLQGTTFWKVHPEWIYCHTCKGDTPEDKIKHALKTSYKGLSDLLRSLLMEAHLTSWFDDPIQKEAENKQYFVNKVFLATQSGLTRWKTYKNRWSEEDDDSFENRNNRAIDEDWYRRAVEENYKNEEEFIYSVPFEISGYENNTMITGTKTVFVRDGPKNKAPIAVVGVQFNHRAMYDIYYKITKQCNTHACDVTCESDYLNCFILDNNAYIILADEIEYTGRYIGDIRPDIMYHLIKDEVYKPTRMFDYQAICQKPPPEKPNDSNEPPRPFRFFTHFLQLFQWILTTIVVLIQSVIAGPDYQSIKEDTLAFEKLEIKKTFPTPCDHEMYLFTTNVQNKFQPGYYPNRTSKFDCDWAYVVDQIPKTNLLFLAINGICKMDTQNTYNKSPTPKEIIYNETLPCYIATMNNYTRRVYMECYKKNVKETFLNNDSYFCGHTWQ